MSALDEARLNFGLFFDGAPPAPRATSFRKSTTDSPGGFFDLRSLIAASIALLASCFSVVAQTAPAAQIGDLQAFSTEVSFYYDKPSDIVGLLKTWEKLGGPKPEAMYGFLAGVFIKEPKRIESVLSAKFQPKTEIIIVSSLCLAGRIADATAAAQSWHWSAEKRAGIVPVGPLHSAKPKGPQGFDILWSASFATGDAAYVRPIYEYFVAVASRNDIDIEDLTAITRSYYRRNSADTERVKAIAVKYPRETYARMVIAASAQWSLVSNAFQHKFVADALDRYTKENPDGAPEKSLRLLREMRQKR